MRKANYFFRRFDFGLPSGLPMSDKDVEFKSEVNSALRDFAKAFAKSPK